MLDTADIVREAWFVSADTSVDVKVTGFVNGLAQELITFSDGEPSLSVVPSNRISVDPRSIVDARYTELKDSKEISESHRAALQSKYGNAALRMTLDSGAQLTIFELAP